MKRILLLNVTFIIVILFLAELIVRFFFDFHTQGISKNLVINDKNLRFNNPNLINGEAFGEKIFTDKNGFRVLKRNIKNNKKVDILFIGGSVTFGPAVNAEKTFVEQLNNNTNLNVVNASVFGSNLKNNYNIFKKFGLNKNIKKIFISFSIDDIDIPNEKQKKTRLAISNKTIVGKIKSIDFIYDLNIWFRSKSALYTWSKGVIFDPQDINYNHDLALYEDVDRLKKMEILLKEISIKHPNLKKNIYFFHIPYEVRVRKKNCYKDDLAEKIVKNYFKKYNFNFIELKNKICKRKNSKKLFLRNDYAHLSIKGHQVIYEELKKYLN